MGERARSKTYYYPQRETNFNKFFQQKMQEISDAQAGNVGPKTFALDDEDK